MYLIESRKKTSPVQVIENCCIWKATRNRLHVPNYKCIKMTLNSFKNIISKLLIQRLMTFDWFNKTSNCLINVNTCEWRFNYLEINPKATFLGYLLVLMWIKVHSYPNIFTGFIIFKIDDMLSKNCVSKIYWKGKKLKFVNNLWRQNVLYLHCVW